MAGVFAANPLSLTVPEPAFDAWLRDNGYLEVLDEPTAARDPAPSDATPSASDAEPPAGTAPAPSSPSPLRGGARRGSLRGALGRVSGSALVGAVRTLLAILATNPFAKLVAEDFAGSTPPWTDGFLTAPGGSEGASSYSWPAGPMQARMRVHENVKRYIRNYVTLWLLFFACTLYKMPLTLLGLVSSLAIWEALRVGCTRWDLEDRYPSLRFVLVRIAQIVTAVILYYCQLQVAVLCATSIGYTVMILHASLRKLMSSKQPAGTNRHKRSRQNK